MFCLGLQSIAHFYSSTRTRPSSTHTGWRVKEIFLKLLHLRWKKMKMLFTGLRSVIRRNCTLGLSTAQGHSRPRAQFLPMRTSNLKLQPITVKVVTPCRPSYKWSSHIFSLSTQQPLTAAKEITYINRSTLRRFFSWNRRWPPVIFTKQPAGFLNFDGELVTFNDHLNRRTNKK